MSGALHRLGTVVALTDGFLDRPAQVAAPRFRLDGSSVVPIAKAQARYVFLNLAAGAHVLEVVAEPFKSCQIDFTLSQESGLAERILRCMLQPGPSYIYPPYITLIRGRFSVAQDEAVISVSYRSLRGRAHHVQTLGQRGQPYAVAVEGKLADPTPVVMRVDLPDGSSAEQAILVRPGRTRRIDISHT